jgi:hypothetical protein
MIAHWPSLSETSCFGSTLTTPRLAVYGRNEMPQGTRDIVALRMNESQWTPNEGSRGSRSLTVVNCFSEQSTNK